MRCEPTPNKAERQRIKYAARLARRAARRTEAQALKTATALLDADPATLTAAQRRARQVAIFGGAND